MNVQLKKWEWNDKQSLISLCNSADRTYLSNCMPEPYTEKDADWWLNMVAEHDGKDGVFRAITIDDQIVGNISVEQKPDVHHIDAEIGYLLLAEQWSKGIMTTAVRQICELAFYELKIMRITGLVYAPNTASQKVLEKNGFALEGVQKNAVIKDEAIYETEYNDVCKSDLK